MKITAYAPALALLLTAPEASAQMCEAQTTQEALQYLRRLNLDLRAETPDLFDLDRVVADGYVDASLVSRIVESDELLRRIRRHHLELLWGNIDSQELVNDQLELSVMGTASDGTPIYWVRQRARIYRRYQYVPCLDEPARFGAGGEILTTASSNPVDPEAPDILQEGWVEVAPYWDPTARIKVCAFDAQADSQTAPNPIDPTAPDVPLCSIPLTRNRPDCGCGPNLNWCQSIPDRTTQFIVRSMAEQFYRLSDEVARGDRPYSDLLLANDVEINGPLSHYFRHQAFGSLGTLVSIPDYRTEMPAISFDRIDTWRTVARDDLYAGVLTMPLFLLRFTTDRGRANRFFSGFLCQEFSPPPGGLPDAEDPCNQEPDLKERCGCKYCHVKVEPGAAHWGRWSESGLSLLRPELFPAERTDCVNNDQDILCRALYTTRAVQPGEDDYVGMLRSYLFADPEMTENIERGPRKFAESAVASGDFARCTTQRLWVSLLGRDVVPGEEAVIAELATDFAQDYALQRLIEAIVTRPEYRQGERFGEKETE
jgi:hypothetical protein